MKKIFLIFLACTAAIPTASYAAKDRSVAEMISVLDGAGIENLKTKEMDKVSFYIGYYSGSFETVMDLGMKLGVLCFPDPMPNLTQFFEEFVRDYLIYSGEEGFDASNDVQIDTMIQISLKKRYPCQEKPK